MNINVNALRFEKSILLIAGGIVFIDLVCSTVRKKVDDNLQDELENTGSHEIPVSAACADERDDAFLIRRSALLGHTLRRS